jgi:5-methylcytosine-specific restriction endonuclease McrA
MLRGERFTGSLPKPERAERKAEKRLEERLRKLTRKQVCQIVFQRKKERCERCGRKVSFDVAAWKDERAQVNDIKPRSLGGDPLDPNNQELTCRKCHFGGPSGAHAPTPARMKKR